MTNPLTGDQAMIASAGAWVPRDYTWTRAMARITLPNRSIDDLVDIITKDLGTQNVTYPDQEILLRRCVTALYVGHLVLQGPPGSGKTTLARALARAFHIDLMSTTATSEWSPYHVVGGLQPDSDGGFVPWHGLVPQAALKGAELAQAHQTGTAGPSDPLAVWLLIDEFNRADIDKAIGSLYTLLSSCDPKHLAETPIELWFESDPAARQLWIPASFRVIGTMNDLDTNYVSAMSQGLRRRFQFVTVTVPHRFSGPSGQLSPELENVYESATDWLTSTYGAIAPPVTDTAVQGNLKIVQTVLEEFRHPSGDDVEGWPVGTAQASDVLKTVVRSGTNDPVSLDIALADRLIGQMNNLTTSQYKHFRTILTDLGLTRSALELEHIWKPYTVQP